MKGSNNRPLPSSQRYSATQCLCNRSCSTTQRIKSCVGALQEGNG
uniref:Uncharacterized protein n=1 Tax=Arundo donax TaxID=35708 RepID=A0A0A9H6K0_ARUDO